MAKTGRIIRWMLVLLMVGVCLTAAVAYLLSARVPDDYDPLTLSAAKRELARKAIDNKLLRALRLAGEIGTYHPGAPRGALGPPGDRSFSLVFTERELNERVASLTDEESIPLRKAGFSRPAIAIGDGRVTVYAHWDKAEKIVGVDMTFAPGPDGSMQCVVEGVRLGALPMPDRVLGAYKNEMIGQLQDRISSWLHPPQQIGKVRIGAITIADDEIALDFESLLGK